MSNLITNGDFSSPIILSNNYLVYSSFTNDMQNQFYWNTTVGTSILLVSGFQTYAPDLSQIASQFISMTLSSSISQSVNLPVSGFYNISFNYAYNYPAINNVIININGTFFDQLPNTYTTVSGGNYALYSNTFNATNPGLITITLQAISNRSFISISNISFVLSYQTGTNNPPLPSPIVATSNNFKSTTINGNFNVVDYKDISNNIITKGFSTMLTSGDTTTLFIGDKNYDPNTAYGTLSISRASNNYNRPHLGFIRYSYNAFQMGFCERFSGFQNNFGFFSNAGYNQLGGSYPSICYNPAICIDGSGYNYVGINTYKPAYNLDISGSFRTSNDIIYNNNSYSLISTVNTISGVLYTHTNNINSISGIVYGHTNSINTLTTNTTKIFYVAGLNTTFIGRTSNSNALDFSDGGLIMNNTSSILGKNFASTIYGGNGFFYNTNGNRRTDFVNITGYSSAGNAATLGGFEFWIHNYNNPAYSIATLDYIGGLTISSIITNAITSPTLTATTRIITPYITVNNLYNIGTSVILTALNNTLTFPLPEIIFCNCSSNAINITLPDIASLTASATCKIQVRRIINTSNQINLLCYGAQSRIYNSSNSLGTAANAIGNCCHILLCNNYWYETSY